MRFLCLHGRGTNAEIFKAQTVVVARIRESLDQDNHFIFINGRVPVDDVPGIGAAAAYSDSERLAFVPLGTKPSVYKAIFHDLREFIRTQGPFDGLMGFSEGASVAATLMVENSIRPFADLKCAILFCTLDTADPNRLLSETSAVRPLNPAEDGILVNVPTAHIWSVCDEVASGSSQKVSSIFEESNKEVLIHSLGHDIPGSRSDEYLHEAIRVIERTIERGKD